jgi:hypothetical protein
MRNLIALVLIVLVLLFSCKKSSSPPAPTKTNLEYLTAHTWQYNKYYLGYVDHSNLGSLAYQRGGGSNTIDLDNDFATFNSDGTVDEIYNGTLIGGTFKFLDNAQTILQVTNDRGVFPSTIVKLNDTDFDWSTTDINNVNRYAEEESKQ